MKISAKINKNLVIRILNIIIIMIAVFTFSYFSFTRTEKVNYSFDASSIYNWGDDWLVSTGNTAGDVMNLPVNLPIERGRTIILKKELPSKIKKYNCILFKSKRQDVHININGVLRSSYSDENTRRFGKSSPEAFVLAPIYSTDANADVTILVSSDSKYSGDIGTIYLGNEMSLVIMLIKSNILWIAFNVAIILLSLVSLLCFFIYRKTIDNSMAFMYLFWFAFLSSLWCFSKLEIRQMFISNIRLHETIGYLCFVFLPISIALYSNLTLRYRYNQISNVLIFMCYINFMVQFLVQFFGHYDLNEMIIFSYIIYFAALIIYIICCFLALKRKDSQDVRFLFTGLIILFATMICDVFNEGIFNDNDVEFVFALGVFAFALLNFFHLFINISREHQLKKEAENANLAKSVFLATMSHEIRTPINAVLGMNEMIKRETREDIIKEYSDNISSAGKSLLALVNDVLDFSKIESGKMDIVLTEYRMQVLLKNILILLKGRMAKKNLKLLLDIDDSIPSVCLGDEVRIRQILTNILTNAVKYTNEGSIKLSVKNSGIDNDNIMLTFSIKDTGIGLKEEDINKLMNSSFVRVDEVRNRNIEGTGLGISITRKLLELMDSKLEIDSVYGEGSDFHFTIRQKIIDKTPMGLLDNSAEKEGDNKKHCSFEAQGAKILAVDDTRTNLIVIKGLLKPYKCEVTICESGMDCIEKCRNNTYDVIFMDHMMPQIDGIETLNILRRDGLISNKTKVYALTANALSGASDMYLENGFDGYIAKPIDVGELDACLIKSLPKELKHTLENDVVE